MAKPTKPHQKNKPKQKLSLKEKKFIALYDGNGTVAAKKAGYSGSNNSLGVMSHSLLRNPKIRKAIDARTQRKNAPTIATREDRQAFWTTVMTDRLEETRDRLKASELLGRSEADFIEKVALTGVDKDGNEIPLVVMLAPQTKGKKGAIS